MGTWIEVVLVRWSILTCWRVSWRSWSYKLRTEENEDTHNQNFSTHWFDSRRRRRTLIHTQSLLETMRECGNRLLFRFFDQREKKQRDFFRFAEFVCVQKSEDRQWEKEGEKVERKRVVMWCDQRCYFFFSIFFF